MTPYKVKKFKRYLTGLKRYYTNTNECHGNKLVTVSAILRQFNAMSKPRKKPKPGKGK